MITATETAILLMGFCGIVAGIVYGIARYRKQQMLDALADETFERVAMSRLRSHEENQTIIPAPVDFPTLEDRPPLIDYTKPYQSPVRQQPAPAAQPSSGDFSTDAITAPIIQKLQNSGICESIDGHLELNGNPRAGVILKLKKDKRALVLPYVETEFFLSRQTRRYDFIILVFRDGRSAVLKDTNDWLADQLAGSMMR